MKANSSTNNILNFEAVVALIYTAVVLTLMDYFFIPPKLESILSGHGVGGWYIPSIEAGLGWSISCLVGFLLIPTLLLKFVFNKSVKDHGFSTDNFWTHLKIYLGLFALMLPFLYFASTQAEFKNLYPFVPAAKTSLQTYFMWEIAYVLQFFALEFFFRGYLLYTLERHMSKWIAIAVMVVPYTMIHFHKPVLETFGAVIAGMVLGHLSLKYRSWLGGAILHSLVALTIDFLASYRSGLFG